MSQYWSTDPLLQTSVFNHIMSRNRIQMILQFIIHFADNSLYDPKDPNRDCLYKVHPIVEFLFNKFKSVYVPSKFISIDEELLLWKGRLIFKQYIPNKKARFGIKMFRLCENSGYLWNSFVYLGKNGEPDPEENSSKAAPQLFDRLKGHHFSSKIPPMKKKVKPQKRYVIVEIRKESIYHCNNCEQMPGLCPAPCFRLYHTLVSYSQP